MVRRRVLHPGADVDKYSTSCGWGTGTDVTRTLEVRTARSRAAGDAGGRRGRGARVLRRRARAGRATEAAAARRARRLLVRGRRGEAAPRRGGGLPAGAQGPPGAARRATCARFVAERGLDVRWSDEIPGTVRCHLDDPFGNRIELSRHRGRTRPAMSRTIRYQQIADDLRGRIAALGGGRLLPSESDLSAEFGVSRVTVRRALELLRDEGLVESRQGFGWYRVRRAAAPAAQRAGRRSRASWRPRASSRRGRSSSSPSSRRPSGSGRSSAPIRCCACAGSTWPTATRSPSSRCGARPSSASTCRAGPSSTARSTSCSASACAAPRRRSAPTPPRADVAELLARSRRAHRCCAASGSPPTRPGGRC